MHDQRKVKEEVDEVQREQNRIAVAQFTTLYDSVLQQRRESVYTEAVLEQLTELLRKNPDAYSMYNYRREVLLHLWEEFKKQRETQQTQNSQQPPEKSTAHITSTGTTLAVGSEAASHSSTKLSVRSPLEWLKEELKLSSSILKRDYKFYAAFEHRRWIFAQLYRLAEEAMTANRSGACSESTNCNDTAADCPEMQFWAETLLKEKMQCDALLAIDERNFHVWNYRRWACRELARLQRLKTRFSINSSEDVPLNETTDGERNEEKQSLGLFLSAELEEFRFTTEMIERNFSNYSAWHQRGLLLQTAIYRLSEEHRKGQLHSEALKREFWAQISEDLSLVTTAIYCDPVDQSAWYYAQFLQRAADMLYGIYSTCEGVDVTCSLVDASLELLEEECRLGEDTEVYWPHLFLLNVLLSEKSKSTDCASGSKCGGGTAAKVRAALFPDNTDEDDWARCIRGLKEHLIAADSLRAGMYSCLAKRGK